MSAFGLLRFAQVVFFMAHAVAVTALEDFFSVLAARFRLFRVLLNRRFLGFA
jgi:hypothetical protein